MLTERCGTIGLRPLRPRRLASHAASDTIYLDRAADLRCGAGRAQSAADAPPLDSSSQVYRCMGGAKLPVVYLNFRGGDSFATICVNAGC